MTIRFRSWALLLSLTAAGCSHSPPHQTVLHFDSELSRLLGRGKQADVRALMGEPAAEELIGEIEVWSYFYASSGGKSPPNPELAKVAPQHDGLILSFDREGTLQHYYLILEGRRAGQGRGRER